MLAQQAGLSLTRNGNPLALDPNWITDDEKRRSALIKHATPDQIPVKMEVGDKLYNLLGISQLIGKLKELLSSLEELPDPNITSTEINIINIKEHILKDLLSKNQGILKKYVENKTRVSLLLKIILDMDPEIKREYQGVISQLKTWKDVLDKILPNTYNLIDQAEKIRLTKLISGERSAGNKQKLREKVVKTILGSTSVSVEQQTKIAKDFVNEFLQIALTINEIRVVSRIESAEINLLGIKKEIDKLKNRYAGIAHNTDEKDKNKVINELNEKLEQLIISIANTIAEIFPHNVNFPTALSGVLANSEAACAGKTNILLTVAKYLGLKARATSILTSFNETKDPHSSAIISLFGEQQLLVDANYPSRHYLAEKDKNESIALLKEKNPSKNEDWINKQYQEWVKFSKENQRHLSKNCKVLVYSISGKKDEKHKYQFTQILKTGKKIVLFASIPHPHLFITIDNSNEIISSPTYYNFASSLRDIFGEYGIAIEMFEIAVEQGHINAHSSLARLIKNYQPWDLKKAEELLIRSLELDPKNIYTKNILDNLY